MGSRDKALGWAVRVEVPLKLTILSVIIDIHLLTIILFSICISCIASRLQTLQPNIRKPPGIFVSGHPSTVCVLLCPHEQTVCQAQIVQTRCTLTMIRTIVTEYVQSCHCISKPGRRSVGSVSSVIRYWLTIMQPFK